jgi:3-methylfumaryl-CoA hydratase
MSDIPINELRQWIGRTESRSERLSPAPATLLNATLDSEEPVMREGMAVPPLFHWLYFLPVCRQSNLDTDGHPIRGGFLPPIPLPRRMWAAGQIDFSAPLIFGEVGTRTSEIIDVTLKHGRSGPLVFVKFRHVITTDAGRVALTETQDLVYRDQPKLGKTAQPDRPAPVSASASASATRTATWTRQVKPDPVLLFRYSALTFNSHRIHYDRPYAIDAEGYPALVVHGPLMATLMVDHLLREMPAARLRRLTFRAERPVFDNAPFVLCIEKAEATEYRLWSCDAAGALCTDASATIGPP